MGRFRTVFMGTPALVVPLLNGLNEISEVDLVVCQPDRPVGRKRRLQPPPVKIRALEMEIPVVQPEKIKNNSVFRDRLAGLQPDVMVVVAYGKILPESLLGIARFGCVNVHYSLLPAYRGAAPVNWALVNGETRTGVSLMKMDKGMDTGPVFASATVEIDLLDNAPGLFEKLTVVATDLLIQKLPLYLDGKLVPVPQDEESATYAPMIQKKDGALDFSLPAIEVHNRIRGFQPWPGGFSAIEGRMFKFLETGLPEDVAVPLPAGTVVVDKKRVFVTCGDGSRLPILKIQPENRRAMDAASCVNGGYLKEGDRFESV